MQIPTRMRRVVVSSGSIDVVDSPTPMPGPGEVLVHSVVSGVCGSDTHAAHGRHPFIALPYHPGHEVVGVVAARGDGVDTVEVGARVTVEPDLPCWQCKQCRRGAENLCENLRFFGCGYEQGGMADYFTIPADRVHVVPDELDYRAAALIEPLSTPVHAVRLAGDVRGQAVVILGAGTIGLLVLAVVRAHGARRVVITDPLPAKRERALRLGADVALDAGSADGVTQARAALGESADFVFDCVAIESTMRAAIGMASKGGTVVVLGVPTGDVAVPLALVQDHQIRIQGSATYLPRDYEESIRLLTAGAVRVDEIVTAEVPMARAADAYALSSGGDHVKVLVGIDEQVLATVS
ncbi:2-desacetyl-2-hydroxyethyl bacteriochlorophyllide A dehydrogenase [Mycolicibacterium rutilum]|uniref:2-desacetyl-2-hydroxyethyl bacteriochlorophyllide A dehydrogenase n=1 Tax=Mycolicibacterium rutilum TaxID=370526 RepID=A0A1H6LG49_MYCRU|nr:alcohol dehydrogenase catalytic domain-containing protein [Mycolicibacterium rutilum]SEH85196.1 2-desacetyl-2-hydroxyethyl bacteriochlorophyllide A dehydrogenase [Mycolicibacterium rutilum]